MRHVIETKLGGRRLSIHYPRPSFLEGMARVMDIGGTMRPRVKILRDRRDASKTGAEQDAEEIREIWAEVGQYIHNAMGRFDHIERGDAELAERRK